MKILDKQVITRHDNIRLVRFIVEAPDIAKKAKAGQFIVVMASEFAERVPLTIVDVDMGRGTITFIVQEIGFSTSVIGKLDIGDSFYALVGPLGRATKIKNKEKAILVAGGVGIAEIHLLAKALKQAQNNVAVIIGAKTKNLLILEEELLKIVDELHITTDDGSCGKKGFVTDTLKELLSLAEGGRHPTPYTLVHAVGPIPMMRAVAEVTRPLGIKTIASLETLMVDATGMCGSCRVTVDGEVKFSCVDGPEFDAHKIDWDELTKRNQIYKNKESHICKLNKQ